MSVKYLLGLALWAAAAVFAAGWLGLVQGSTSTLLLIAAALALLAGAVAWLLHVLDRRLSVITQATERLAAGAERVHLDDSGGGDIARLERSFNDMSQAMQTRMGDLQLSLQQQRTIADHVPDAMWIFHVEAFRLVDVNENFLRLLQRPRSEVIGKTLMDLSPPLQSGDTPTETYTRQIIARALKGETVVLPWTIRTRSGADVPCELRAVQLPAQDRTLICGSLADVSARLRAEAELAYRREFEALVMRLSTGMLGLAPARIDEGVHHALAEVGRFAQVDRSYLFLFDETGTRVTCTHEWCAPGIEPQIGRLANLRVADFPWVESRLSRGEVVHVPRLDELPPEAAAERNEWNAEAIRSLLLVPTRIGGRVPGYVGFDSVHAEKHWPDDIISLLGLVGEMVVNALERSRAAGLLQRQRENLERSNGDLAQFAYAVSHDLQEPLRAISGFSSLLAQRYRGRLDAEADEYIHYTIESASRLRRMISDLLEYSRLESRTSSFSQCSLDQALDLALENLRAVITDSGAEIVREPLPPAMGDPSQLIQLFQNLVGNAIKFRAAAPPCVQIEARRDGSLLTLAVCDNGIGIAEAQAPRLFQIFRRLHDSTKYPGSGIGLAMCRRIVERHGGRIWVEPNPGGGSAFRFTLPAAETAAGPPA